MNILRLFFLTLFLAQLSAPATAKVMTYGDWLVYDQKENGNITCVMSSEPTKSAGKYTKRGSVYMVITHRPAEQRFGEISFQAGYTFKKGSAVAVTIDGKKKFSLMSNKGHAWTIDYETDKKLIKAMRAGSSLVIKGVSARGTKTTDTFSLSGFTAASKSINKTCQVK